MGHYYYYYYYFLFCFLVLNSPLLPLILMVDNHHRVAQYGITCRLLKSNKSGKYFIFFSPIKLSAFPNFLLHCYIKLLCTFLFLSFPGPKCLGHWLYSIELLKVVGEVVSYQLFLQEPKEVYPRFWEKVLLSRHPHKYFHTCQMNISFLDK